jgi:signal transduction histidine kinase
MSYEWLEVIDGRSDRPPGQRPGAGPEGPRFDGGSAGRPLVVASSRDAEALGKVVHELRAALGGVVAQAETMSECAGLVPPEVFAEQLRRLADQGERLRAMMARLLDFSAASAREVETRPVRIAEVVRGLLDAEPTPPHCCVELQLEDDLVIVTDPLSLNQILANLLRNAYDHGGPDIVVAASEVDGAVEVSVADDGPGIPDGSLATIFGPFARAADAEGPGWGLGLAISVELAHALDGMLTYAECSPSGACFTVTLPAT